MNVVYLRRRLPILPEDQRDIHATGLILAFSVDDLEGELARLQAEGVPITMTLTTEEWGEQAFQVRDPNGIIVQFLDWTGAAASDPGTGTPDVSRPEQREFQAPLDVWAAAIVANDPHRIRSFTTADWMLVTPEGGPVGLDRFLGLVASGDLVHTDMTLELLDVRVHGTSPTPGPAAPTTAPGRGSRSAPTSGSPRSSSATATAGSAPCPR